MFMDEKFAQQNKKVEYILFRFVGRVRVITNSIFHNVSVPLCSLTDALCLLRITEIIMLLMLHIHAKVFGGALKYTPIVYCSSVHIISI